MKVGAISKSVRQADLRIHTASVACFSSRKEFSATEMTKVPLGCVTGQLGGTTKRMETSGKMTTLVTCILSCMYMVSKQQ